MPSAPDNRSPNNNPRDNSPTTPLPAPFAEVADAWKSYVETLMNWSSLRAEQRLEKRAKVVDAYTKNGLTDKLMRNGSADNGSADAAVAHEQSATHATADLAAAYALDAVQSAILTCYSLQIGRPLLEGLPLTPAQLWLRSSTQALEHMTQMNQKSCDLWHNISATLAQRDMKRDAKTQEEPKKQADTPPKAKQSRNFIFSLDVTPFREPVSPEPQPTAPEPIAAEPTAAQNLAQEPAPAHSNAAMTLGGLPLLLSAPRSEGADALTTLKGIGPKIAQILNSLGIYHFDQLATLTPEQVAWLEDKIDFRGRITREKWVEQAQSIVKPGTSSSPAL
jgi:predicted flap endonuclease-1-like 5' DNA nuclease